MEDKTSRSSASAQSMETPQIRQNAVPEPKGESLDQAITAADRVGDSNATPVAKTNEHRQAYGTAKTENLRDNGLWRIILPVVVVLFGLALVAVPLIILIPLLNTSLDPGKAIFHLNVTWIWIVMILIEMGLVALIVWGIFRIFLTQAGNYRR